MKAEIKDVNGKHKVLVTHKNRVFIVQCAESDVKYFKGNVNTTIDEFKKECQAELLNACIHALEMCNETVMPTENDLTIMAGRLKAVIKKATE